LTPAPRHSTFPPAVAENQPLRRNRNKQNRMTSTCSFADFTSRLREFIKRCQDNEDEFRHLALVLFGLQFEQVEPYRQLCQARGAAPGKIAHWTEIPCVPTTAFKEFEFSSLPLAERSTVFRSSGTTGEQRSRHFHNAESLAIYEASLLPWFKRHLLADKNRFLLISLTPSPGLVLGSSLAHMLGIAHRELGSPESRFTGTLDATGAWGVDLAAALAAFRNAISADRPVAILGTAFGILQILSFLSLRQIALRLPAGSRVMETGGYKGRFRELPKARLHALITDRLGIPASHIVSEYGMSELSSQAYDHVVAAYAATVQSSESSKIRPAGAQTAQPFNPSTLQLQPFNPSPSQRTFAFPPWARARVVSPETGQEVHEGETGLIQVYDLANVRSVLAIRTEDLAVRRGGGFELIGRVASAEPRGCSLMSLSETSGTAGEQES
jgi:hypothetical protein